jgi:alpha-glucosidase
VFQPSRRRTSTTSGQNDELHPLFELPACVATLWEAPAWRERIASVAGRFDPIGAWPTWVLSNHDTPRHRSRFGSDARARAAAVMLLGLRGTPFLYAGEEFGLEDADVPFERRVDPGGRDGCRAPIPWNASPTHGWAGADPWLPWPPHVETRNADAERADPTSMLHLYRRLLAFRRTSPALREGSIQLVDAPDGVVAFERRSEGHRCTVVVNFTSEPRSFAAGGKIRVASDGAGEGGYFSGTLRPDQAIVIGR